MECRTPLNPSDELTGKHMIEKTLELDKDLKEYHFAILDPIELEYDIKSEPATLDEHDEKIGCILDRLQLLLTPVK